MGLSCDFLSSKNNYLTNCLFSSLSCQYVTLFDVRSYLSFLIHKGLGVLSFFLLLLSWYNVATHFKLHFCIHKCVLLKGHLHIFIHVQYVIMKEMCILYGSLKRSYSTKSSLQPEARFEFTSAAEQVKNFKKESVLLEVR